MDEITESTASDESASMQIQETVMGSGVGTEDTQEIVVVDYTPVIYDVGNGIMACVLFGAFLIAGILCVFKIMEANPHDR